MNCLIFIRKSGTFKSHCHADVQGEKSSFFILSVTNLVFLLSLQQLVRECGGIRWRANINLNHLIWWSLVSFGWEYSESQMWGSRTFFLKIVWPVGYVSYITGKSWSPQVWCLVPPPGYFTPLSSGSVWGNLNSHLSFSLIFCHFVQVPLNSLVYSTHLITGFVSHTVFILEVCSIAFMSMLQSLLTLQSVLSGNVGPNSVVQEPRRLEKSKDIVLTTASNVTQAVMSEHTKQFIPKASNYSGNRTCYH